MSRYPPRYNNVDREDRLRQDKEALFGGARQQQYRAPPSRGSSSQGYGSPVRDRYMPPGSDSYDDRRRHGVTAENATEEDVDYVRGQIKNTKMQSLQSSRNALRMVTEAEESAVRTMNKLGTQSEMLNSIENRMDISQLHAENASSKSAHLKDLNRSMFRPAFKNPFQSKKRHEARVAKAEAEHLASQKRRDDLRVQQEETRMRVRNGIPGNSAGSPYERRSPAPAESYGRYQFEADEEDHEQEREIASNMDNILDAVSRLKNMSLGMSSEIQRQNSSIERVTGKVDKTGATIAGGSARIRSIR